MKGTFINGQGKKEQYGDQLTFKYKTSSGRVTEKTAYSNDGKQPEEKTVYTYTKI